MARNTSNIVIAEFDTFDYRNGHGFVVADGQRYFIQQSTCREVGGTLDKPKLTKVRSNRAPGVSMDTLHLHRMILRVEESAARPKVVAWGVLPERTWLEELLHRRTFNRFVGGRVNIEYLFRGRVHTQVHGRLLSVPELRPGTPWQLALSYYGFRGILGTTSATFDLKASRPDLTSNGQRYKLSMYGETCNDWIGVTLIQDGH